MKVALLYAPRVETVLLGWSRTDVSVCQDMSVRLHITHSVWYNTVGDYNIPVRSVPITEC